MTTSLNIESNKKSKPRQQYGYRPNMQPPFPPYPSYPPPPGLFGPPGPCGPPRPSRKRNVSYREEKTWESIDRESTRRYKRQLNQYGKVEICPYSASSSHTCSQACIDRFRPKYNEPSSKRPKTHHNHNRKMPLNSNAVNNNHWKCPKCTLNNYKTSSCAVCNYSYRSHQPVRPKEISPVRERDIRQIRELEMKLRDKDAIIDELHQENEKMRNKLDCVIIWQFRENNGKWISYNGRVSKIIEDLRPRYSYNYQCTDNGQNYVITKLSANHAKQVNINTKKKRKVTRIKKERGLNRNEYPDWWIMTDIDLDKEYSEKRDQQYAKPRLITLNLNEMPAEGVIAEFNRTLPNVEVIKIEGIQNQYLYDGYCDAERKLIKLIGKNKLNERRVFHGTKHGDVMKIVQREGFRKEFNSKASWGKGTYFARDAKYSAHYSCRDNDGIQKIFLCKVMMGESHIGDKKYELRAWPKKNGGEGPIYDSLVDRMDNPAIFVIHDDARAYPMFVIHFR